MEPSAWTCVAAALSLMEVAGGDDVKHGGYSLRCCVQPLALKLKYNKRRKFAEIRVFVLNIP